MKRVFLVVLDSVGIGALPDAAAFGDAGANTLASLTRSPRLNIPHLTALGLGCIEGVDAIPAAGAPLAAHGRAREASRGKDTTVGHWELAGLVSPAPLPTFPDGFPAELIAELSRAVGRGVLCNRPYSGTAVIAEYGEEHLRTGDLIVYTSADSVFQIAAHEDIVPPEQLYEYCRVARRLLTGPYAVGRVIARPFVGRPGEFIRTDRRRDFSLAPPADTLTDAVLAAGLDSIAVGKIRDIFDGRGIGMHIPTHSNREGMEALSALLDRDFTGLAFVNLVDFDMLYGHRRDIDGYAAALSAFDDCLGDLLPRLREGDMLVVTADHGCDPGYTQTTDHTREYVPVLAVGPGVRPVALGTRATLADVGATVAEALGLSFRGAGSSFYKEITE